MMKIGIVAAFVREGSNTEQVANWTLNYANGRNDEGVTYELVSLKDFDLPMFGTTPTDAQGADIQRWKDTIAGFDGYVFVTPEYNRALPGFFKNALDYLQPEVHNKPVGYTALGGLGGLSSIQTLRLINGEQEMADVRTMVTFSLMADFENFSVFKPNAYHTDNADKMFGQVLTWAKALKTIRD